MKVSFLIPLQAKSNDEQWSVVSGLLGVTIRSILRQTDPRFRILICGQDRPDMADLDDPRITFIQISAPRPGAETKEKRRDKSAKKNILLRAAQENADGYVMLLDANDLVHHGLVDYVITTGNPNGYLVETGFLEDMATGTMALSSTLLKKPFHQYCGSCSVLPSPRTADDMDFLLRPHAAWAEESLLLGRPLQTIPFPAVVYRVNSAVQLSFERRQSNDFFRTVYASISAADDPQSRRFFVD